MSEKDVQAYSGHDWGEKLSFTVGVSYMVGKQLKFLKTLNLNIISIMKNSWCFWIFERIL